jgi:diguanylate cyclase (GGDEF)-like protein
MPGQLFDPEVASSVPEIIRYSVAAAGVAIGGLALTLGRQKSSVEERLRISEQERLLDSKTGLLNYRAFEDEFAKRTGNIQRSADIDKVHGLLLADIDDFKALNTNLTHIVTDRIALLPVADIFKQTLRPESDVVAKFGGEEFVTLLSDTDPEGVLTVCKNLQGKVNALHPDGSPLGLTVAYTTFEQGASLEGLMKHLSAELTQAKNVPGKNQIVALQAVEA